ncbi:hypothetical protein [Streptomyces gilvosporeus]|uniref:Uncharacterized protein n=1 Tax=Streptomyces gilvosporeus TaxID=553510 RepID=A0A1V0U2N5_9ACTN|nr:hypothetical protein [Streptomyces gilvosporeus]ARF59417.1 hypothetical protein B1H19_13535 [Streptomyces gilvosporeus]
MDFNLTAEEEALVFHMASLLCANRSPTDDDLAGELGDEVRPLLQSLLYKGWFVIDKERELTLSVIAWAAVSRRRDVEGPQ